MPKKNLKDLKTQDPLLRPPVVTIMGHVDHGKTSLLDFIRKTKVADKEYGGITQSIGAYQAVFKNKKITFIDTPGHAAFTKMRAYGGKAADIVVLVVAADDGVMPQTKEAISHVKNANSPMIVAINKIDMPGSDTNKVRQQLAENEVLVEGWGGDVICVEVSAKTGEGVDKLLEAILALAEMLELKGDPKGDLEGIIIESRIDPKRGPVFSGIVKNGTLKVGNEIFTSGVSAKVRALLDFKSENVVEAMPSDPIFVLGFPVAPKVGELFIDPKNKDLMEQKLSEKVSDEIYSDETKVINIILKADTTGSLEALEGSLKKLESEGAKVKFLHKGTGEITESDVLLAHSSKAVILGFNVKTSSNVSELTDSLKVAVRTYNVIYELLDNIEGVLKEALVKEEIKVKGRAEVLKIFPLESGDLIAGCKVLGGALRSSSKVSIFREGTEEALYSGKIKHLRRGKEEVNIVGKDVECGVLLNPIFKELKAKDIIEVL